MKFLIAANWKMNPKSAKEAKNLFETVKKRVKKINNAEAVICPPFVYLPLLKGLILGAQNVSCEKEGAFTGDISALQLNDAGVKHAIVGHSERRKYFGETDETINKKIKMCLSAGIKPILCVGETAEENEAGKKSEILEKQITDGLRGIPLQKAKNIIFAYEPVWAIGTGKNCSAEETTGSALLIRKIVSKIYGRKFAGLTRILYGGSVNSKNASQYIKETGVNGLLIGGASLNAKEFVDIIRQVSA